MLLTGAFLISPTIMMIAVVLVVLCEAKSTLLRSAK